MSSTQDSNNSTASKSYKKLACLYHFIDRQRSFSFSALETFLELEGDINYQVPESNCSKFIKSDFIGNTALHFVALQFDVPANTIPLNLDTWVERCDEKSAELLISHGANPAIQNQQGLTPIHHVVRCVYKIKFKNYDPYMAQSRLEIPFINVLLAAHIRQKNTTNPRDPYGISHFHAACMFNDTAVGEFYLNNQISIDEAVNIDSPMFPGYTPLHFAVRFGCIEVANILLSRGTNLMLKDSKSMTALHLAIERNMRIIRLLNWYQQDTVRSDEQTQRMEKCIIQVRNTESIIASILSKMDRTMIGSMSLTPFYTMHTSKDALVVEDNINKAIDMDSPYWSGYTPLHFAARLNAETFKKLIKHGADMEATDANGDTPFDMCLGIYVVEDLHEIICSNGKWQDILLSDGKTKLVDLLRTMRNASEFKNYIVNNIPDINNICISMDSTLWPGCTILHLAVILSKKFIKAENYYFTVFESHHIRPNELIEICVHLDADVTIQDLYGSTPLHLALRQLGLDDTYFLIENCNGKSNPVDGDNLSHLHIACAMSNEKAVKKFIDCGIDVNGALSSSFKCEAQINHILDLDMSQIEYTTIYEGSTALHIAVIVGSRAIVKLLIEAGADIDAKDVNGLTALHLLFMNSALKESIGEILLSPLVSKDSVADGLNYLHVAAYGCCTEAVEKFVRLGADVNSAVQSRSFFNEFEGNTPLHTAVINEKKDAMVALITHGANVYTKNSKGASPICDILMKDYFLRHFIAVMKDDDEKRLIEEMGITKLHMACKLFDEKMIEDCVKKDANVNAQIRNDSKIWPGYTPLHIIVAYYHPIEHKDKICRIMRFLLRNGADVTIADMRGETPLLMDIANEHVEDKRHIEILVESLKNTVVNPSNPRGISHFHIACIHNNVAVVERFLELGVDVNQTVDYLSDVHPGFTPLHFASCRDCNWLRSDIPPFRTIDLLLKYGANVHARDLTDNTPLHIAASYRSFFHLPYKRILWAGADPEAKNVDGRVPLNYLLDENVYNWFNWYSCGFGIRRRLILL